MEENTKSDAIFVAWGIFLERAQGEKITIKLLDSTPRYVVSTPSAHICCFHINERFCRGEDPMEVAQRFIDLLKLRFEA